MEGRIGTEVRNGAWSPMELLFLSWGFFHDISYLDIPGLRAWEERGLGPGVFTRACMVS